MEAFIKPPKRIPFYIRIGIGIAKRVTGKDLLAPRILSWYPRVAVSSGILESLVAHGRKELNKRILKLVRMAVSFTVSCPFCIDMNSHEYEKQHITGAEMLALQGSAELDSVETFTAPEKLAVAYARVISRTPLSFPSELIEKLKETFTEKEIVILASTAAQVNYWARMIQALGIPPAGFSDRCKVNLTGHLSGQNDLAPEVKDILHTDNR
jgi:alkylhydroperoxidase family enzyme